MMENEFCEIDFTTATAWENFNARLEEIFYGWKLYQSPDEVSIQNGKFFSCELGSWLISREILEFDGKEFDISFYLKQKSLLENENSNEGEQESSESVIKNQSSRSTQVLNNFPLEINCLSKKAKEPESTEKLLKLIRLFDLNNFVLLTPSESTSPICSETQVKLLISSFCISAFNTRCFVPIFTQVFQEWQNSFIGVRVDEDGFRVDYQMIHLGKVPSKFHYFSGILDLFKSKITNTLSTNSVWASVKLSYSVSQFRSFAWPRKRPVSLEDGIDEPFQLQSFELPFGAASEPVSEIRLHVTWPKVFENMVMDNENHSDFDPLNAPNWVLQVFAKQTSHLLSQHVLKFMQVCQSSTNIDELIGDLLKRRHFNELNVPSNLSISRIISGTNVSGNMNNMNEIKGSKRFLPEETLVSMLYYLFPDADQSNAHPYPSKFSEDSKEDISLKGMKTCGIDELPWRLSIIMCVIVHAYGGHAAAQFWYEFIQELRFRWEKALKIPGIKKGVPNHKTSLMNQKLQMLNCCIQKKIKRENIDVLSEDSDDQNNSCPNSAVPVDSEDEEFFDCQTESKDENNFKVAKVSLWNQPEGRLRKFNNLRLIETGEFMYIPITQEMTPKTEDQLEDDAVVLMKLGSDSQGSKLRARMMCASLYSDMESFKAANPGSILEDFIRWYSPRDWIESSELDQFGQKKGKLSNRMLLPGNMWKEVWDTSFPVPASRQKCLFDDIKESEKVLHFFESHKNLSGVFSLLLPTLVHASLRTTINDETVILLRRYSPYLDEKINLLIQKSVAATRNTNVDLSQYEVVADEISEIEGIVTRYKSVEFKLFPGELAHNEEEKNMLMELVLGQREIIVSQGASSRLGRRVVFLFAKENDNAGQTGVTLERKKDESGSFVNATNEFLHSAAASFNTTISHNPADQWRTITSPPYQKEFVLHVTSPLPFSTSRPSSHSLSAHICAEEIFIASNFCRDSVFV